MARAALATEIPLPSSIKKYLTKPQAYAGPTIDSFNEIHKGHIGSPYKYIQTFETGDLEDPQTKPRVQSCAGSPKELFEILSSGVTGIGLYRTESAFSENTESKNILRILYAQANAAPDFKNFANFQSAQMHELFSALKDSGQKISINIRLLDKPVEELFWKDEELESLPYKAPYLRGTDFAQAMPGLYETQLDSIFKSMANSGLTANQIDVGIMLPNVTNAQQVEHFRNIKTQKRTQYIPSHEIRFGAMIENEKACRQIENIAALCNFISFGTNDLSANLLHYSRQEMNPWGVKWEGRDYSPFNYLAPEVKDLMAAAIERARSANPELHIGICGDQISSGHGICGGMEFALDQQIDSVSMRPRLESINSARLILHELTNEIRKRNNLLPAENKIEPEIR